jgi:RNA polymerase sigma-70 factor (ECF subfamily)
LGTRDERGRDEVVRLAPAHADALYNFARWLVGDAVEAEDLVQETYVRALGAAGQFEAGTNLKAWLFRILRNAHLDRRRRRHNDPTVLREDFDEAPDQERGLLRDDIELDRLRAVVAEEIESALRSLSRDFRSVILLDLEGMTEVEIADVMGCAVGTVKSRLSRARAELRERLREYRP